MAKALHALKEHLNYRNWKLCYVSYGTYVAQVYAEKYPDDVRALILDSPISDISTYYNHNSSNYLHGLENMFKDCAASPDCQALYPNLEEIYYKTIAALEKNPITVPVDKSVVPSGRFTYNADDFKIAIHQALYQKILVEVLPLLIQDFHDRNEPTLGALVSAFAGALRLDYGVYYCVSCTEALPNNALEQYRQDAESHPGLSGGLSFYRSDFVVCNKWNQLEALDSSQLQPPMLPAQVPTLVIAGEYDPITPLSNGQALHRQYPQVQLVEAETFGHAAGFSNNGRKIVEAFFNAPDQPVDDLFEQATIQFATHVYKHEGLAAMGNSLNGGDLLFFAPLLIALLISIGALLVYPVVIVRRRKVDSGASQGLRVLLTIGSVLAVAILVGLGWGLNQTAAYNFYILAFGVLEQYAFVFQLLLPFMLVLALAFLLFMVRIKKVEDRSIYFAVLFSHGLILVYLLYWGVL
ncbi:MAG: alpha/beta fold hydrolase [Phaeodactylibacter sp.]|nr:alpha/beta fold hydrolase [Phaeodactylibacter sp.]